MEPDVFIGNTGRERLNADRAEALRVEAMPALREARIFVTPLNMVSVLVCGSILVPLDFELLR